jgi:DNA-binding transcriptional ArsR family regulator
MGSRKDKSVLEDDSYITDLHQIMAAVSDPIRLQTLELLCQTNSLPLGELADKLGIDDHTKILPHLRKLKEIGAIDQQENKIYVLTQKGLRFVEGLEKLQWNTCK